MAPGCPKTAVGRAKTYDPETVLHTAMLVFWRKGYDSTSLSDLEAATGLHRKSLLLEFESKEALFLKALRHYVQVKAIPDGGALRKNPPGTANIRKFFKDIRYKQKDEWGCLLLLTLLEQENVPRAALTIVDEVYSAIEEAFYGNLMPLVRQGKLTRARARSLARYLQNCLYGIIVNARAGKTNQHLRQVVTIVLESLPE